VHIRPRGELRARLHRARELNVQKTNGQTLTSTQLSTHLARAHYTQLECKRRAAAGQISLAHALAAARAAKNVVLLGDPQQLEQPTRGAHPDSADVAGLVHVLGKDRATLADDQGLFLAFASELYYERPCAFMKGRVPSALARRSVDLLCSRTDSSTSNEGCRSLGTRLQSAYADRLAQRRRPISESSKRASCHQEQ